METGSSCQHGIRGSDRSITVCYPSVPGVDAHMADSRPYPGEYRGIIPGNITNRPRSKVTTYKGLTSAQDPEPDHDAWRSRTNQMCPDGSPERKLNLSAMVREPALACVQRGLWRMRRVQRLQTHAWPHGLPDCAVASHNDLRFATNSKGRRHHFLGCRCGNWGSWEPQRYT